MIPEQQNNPLYIIDSCCFGCCSLKTGCFLLGVLHLVAVILGIIFTIYLSVSTTPFFLIGTFLLILILIFNCYFINGVKNEIVQSVKLWLYYIAFFIILDIIGSIQSIINGNKGIIAFVIIATFQIYVIIVINSYKHELLLKQNETSQQDAEAEGSTTGQNTQTGGTDVDDSDDKHQALTSLAANEYKMNSGQQPMVPPGQYVGGEQGQPMGPLDPNQLMMNTDPNQRYLQNFQPQQSMMTYSDQQNRNIACAQYPGYQPLYPNQQNTSPAFAPYPAYQPMYPNQQNRGDAFSQYPAYQPMYSDPNAAAVRYIAPPAYSVVDSNDQQNQEKTEQSKDKTDYNQ